VKYTYAYKTSDGVRHEDAMEAASREEVFAALRAKGIKAIKVVASDGSKANGEVKGIRHRVVVVGTAVLVLCALVAIVLAYNAGERGGIEEAAQVVEGKARRQVIGDAAVIEKGIKNGWRDVFDNEGDRFLASFAIPGVKAGVRNTSVEEIGKVLGEHIRFSDDDTLESRQIKAMVEGMKDEARAYIAAGGTVVEYGKRLTERQDAEIAIFKRTEEEVLAAQKTMDESAFAAYLDQRNDELRNLGIRPVTLAE